jgi:hypothetical protein
MEWEQWATLIFLIALFPSAEGGLAEPPTARIGRALFHRARSASKGGSPGPPPLY